MKEQWDARYRSTEYIYGSEPNAWLVQNLPAKPHGKILFPAEGEGRNAVYAAQNGWTVHAFDQSAVGQEKAQQLASEKGVSIEYLVGDALDMSYPPETFDALALIYAHFPVPKRKMITQKILQSLKKGGIIIFEAFSAQQPSYQEKYGSGGPKEMGMLYTLDNIREEFGEIAFTKLREEEVLLSEGPFHQGPASVIRFAGIKQGTG